MHSILILSILIIGLLIYFFSNEKKGRKRLSIWAGLNLFMYGALRSTSVGIDVPFYENAYQMLPNISFESLFTSTHLILSRDPFFYAFIKFLTFISEDPQFMLIVISAIVAICFSIFVYKNSINPLLSIIMFIGLRYYSFTLTGLRQAIAWSIVMLSYEFIKDKKLIRFIATVCIASLFHSSAILFIVAYPLANIREIGRFSLIVGAGLYLNFATDNLILKLLVKLPLLQQYESYIYREEFATTGMTMLIIYFSILLFTLFMKKSFLKKTDNANLMFNLSLIGFAITTLGYDYANIFRIGYYFIFPIVLLLPSVIKSSFDKKSQLIVTFVVIVLLVMQFIILDPGGGTQNYKFFWNN